jgi:hypothetical protein
MKKLVLALSALSLLGAAATPAIASPCRDKAGKFVKCPAAKAKPKTCRDKNGKFIKCK